MKQMIVLQFYCFVLVLLHAFALSSSSSIIPEIKHHVRITNNFKNKAFAYHCKSRDDDLGSTFFNCYFSYEHFSSTFDVYSRYLKQEVGGSKFFWTVQEDGFYLYHPRLGQNVKMHVWTDI
ncbi:s-protein like protein 2 [Quercus suber]|uniref:S-protein like protein 2 n=1 Tax=Quercus suber TaxID=58331 RepID=A0AAW0LJG0_QUESU